ncbi:MAG TPA: response regulator [Gemmataceae bacterium]|nr:response regulator [Gemmataceae bacterium]
MNSRPTAPKQILIVDDDAQAREGLALVMEAAGHAVRTAANGLEALQQLRTSRADVILLDLAMPTMDGWTFRIQQLGDPALADIPVMVLSVGGDSLRPEAARLGFVKCFRKASAGDEILDLLGEVFDVLDQGGMA